MLHHTWGLLFGCLPFVLPILYIVQTTQGLLLISYQDNCRLVIIFFTKKVAYLAFSLSLSINQEDDMTSVNIIHNCTLVSLFTWFAVVTLIQPIPKDTL